MNKQIFVINGSGRVGKDTFVNLVSEEVNNSKRKFHTVINFSSVAKVKSIAREIGWDGGKTEKDRRFLSDLKALTTDYCDMPFKSMKKQVHEFMEDDTSQVLFIHIREPEEIARAVKEFDAKTILVVRNVVEPIRSNASDRRVYDYEYDYVIENDGTIEELKKKAKDFVGGVVL